MSTPNCVMPSSAIPGSVATVFWEITHVSVVAVTVESAVTVIATVSVSVSASDNAGAAGISTVLKIDGVTFAQGNGGTLGYSWNTRKVAYGQHVLTAVARDAAGNTSTTSVT